MNRSLHFRIASGWLVTALLLRAAIPVGYMPAAIGGELLFEMCPSAVPADLLAAISGQNHHASHHAGHHDGAGEAHTDGRHFDASHCPIGQVLSAAAAVDHDQGSTAAAPQATLVVAASQAPVSVALPGRRSRGPPA